MLVERLLNRLIGIACFMLHAIISGYCLHMLTQVTVENSNFRHFLCKTGVHSARNLELPGTGNQPPRGNKLWRQQRQYIPGWVAQSIHAISKIFIFLDFICRLDCHPGYVALQTPILTCVEGKYHPQARLWQNLQENSEIFDFILWYTLSTRSIFDMAVCKTQW